MKVMKRLFILTLILVAVVADIFFASPVNRFRLPDRQCRMDLICMETDHGEQQMAAAFSVPIKVAQLCKLRKGVVYEL